MKVGRNTLQGMRCRGIQVLFDMIINMAMSQRHLSSVVKILSADTKVHRNRIFNQNMFTKKINDLCTSPEYKMIVYDKYVHG